MPTGCDQVLSQTVTPNIWFPDSLNSRDLCTDHRLDDYNNYCSRSDAQNYWGLPPPPVENGNIHPIKRL
jgi:hypothetical protein